MEKTKLIFIVVIFSFHVYCQENINIVRPGLIKVMCTISPSKMLNNGGSYFYFHGNSDVYLNEKISFSGDYFNFLGGINNKSDFSYNHNILYGFSIHNAKRNNDLFVSLQPGFAISKLKVDYVNFTKTQIAYNPVFSLTFGDNFYVSKFFHFFLQTRLILGEHIFDRNINLTEVRVSFGLGFNINSIKEK